MACFSETCRLFRRCNPIPSRKRRTDSPIYLKKKREREYGYVNQCLPRSSWSLPARSYMGGWMPLGAYHASRVPPPRARYWVSLKATYKVCGTHSASKRPGIGRYARVVGVGRGVVYGWMDGWIMAAWCQGMWLPETESLALVRY